MHAPDLPQDETARLADLENFGILDTLPERAYDDICNLAAALFTVPIALVSLVDKERQWFKARVGLEATETPRRVAFCAHAILEPDQIFEVCDATRDERFADNPLVTGPPHVRYYCGAPLVTSAGHAMGTLCVIDHEPREADTELRASLSALSRMVVDQLDLRMEMRQRAALETELRRSNADLERSAYAISHDLKSPLRAVRNLAQWALEDAGDGLPAAAREHLKHLDERAETMHALIDSLIDYARAGGASEPQSLDMGELLGEVVALLDVPGDMQIVATSELPRIQAPRGPMHQVLANLLSNALRHHDGGGEGRVEVAARDTGTSWEFRVSDDGPGIPAERRESAFELFTSHVADGGDRGTGVGLALVRRIVESHAGRVELEPGDGGRGATFRFTWPKACPGATLE